MGIPAIPPFSTMPQAGLNAIPAVQVQNQAYMPIQPKRELVDEEQAGVHKGLSRWYPALFKNYGTPLTDLLASPGKNALLNSLFAALAGGGIGAIGLRSSINPGLAGKAGMLCALGFALISALVTFAFRKQSNGNIIDMLKRLPSGETYRDLLSDPIYRQDQLYGTMPGGSGGYSNRSTGALAGALIGSALSSYMSSSGYGSSSYRRSNFSRLV